jgi:hypothetical protein
MWNDNLPLYVLKQLYKHWKRWIVVSLRFPTPPPKQRVHVIMSMSNYQEVNVDLAKHPLVNKERKEAKDISVLIIKTCIIQLDIQN